jgi:beta-xylosidase
MTTSAAIPETKTDLVPACRYPWTPDQGDGQYRNPIICADYSDPDVIRHGEDFYMTASSFQCTPGLPILHSRDLVNWTLINHAVRNLPHPRYDQVQPGCGIWAPAIRFHAGKFWIFFAMPDEGIYVTTADDPRECWTEPRLLQAGRGLIDPCPLWDDDGKAYLVHAYARSRAGICDVLHVRPMAPDASQLLGEGRRVFHSPVRHPTIEGPKFLKRNGWYYLFAPAGGVASGWQVVLRSREIYGPYEDRIVLERGGSPINGPHQGALVDLPDGESWFIHFQDADVYGRIVHLQPVVWRDDWPMIGVDGDGNGIGEPVINFRLPKSGTRAPLAVPQTSDDFDSAELGLQWQWQANHRPEWFSLANDRRGLRLFSQNVPEADLAKVPNLLLQKFPARSFDVETSVTFAPTVNDEESGLVITGRTFFALAIRKTSTGLQLLFRQNGSDYVIANDVPSNARIKAQIREGGICSFCFSADGNGWKSLKESFRATAGLWIGAKIGIYSIGCGEARGWADFDYFRFSSGE